MSAIVKDDWTNCEKNIKHLKNQKGIGFIALVVSENKEINEFGEKIYFQKFLWLKFAPNCPKMTKIGQILRCIILGDEKIVTYMS